MSKKEPRDEWILCTFLVEPSVKVKFESLIRLHGYKTISEALREYMRGVVKTWENDKDDG